MKKKGVKKASSTPATKADSGKRPVAFEYFDPGAKTVSVAGDFNQWNATARPLARDSGRRWTVSIKLAPGTYHYRFVVDGDRWVEDPLNHVRAPNDYGRNLQLHSPGYGVKGNQRARVFIHNTDNSKRRRGGTPCDVSDARDG